MGYQNEPQDGVACFEDLTIRLLNLMCLLFYCAFCAVLLTCWVLFFIMCCVCFIETKASGLLWETVFFSYLHLCNPMGSDALCRETDAM